VSDSPSSRDNGFTLIELLLAIAIMGGAGVALIGVMVNLLIATEHHRGYASVDVAARNFADVIASAAAFETTLSSAVSTGTTTITVANGTWFPAADPATTPPTSFDVSIEAERLTVTNRSGNTLTVSRGVAGTTAATHATGASVARILGECPQVSDLTPPAGKFSNPTNVTSTVISAVTWWVPTGPATGNFTSSLSACQNYVKTLCPNFPTDDRPECDPGLTSVLVTAQGSRGVRSTKTTSYVLVRKGNG